MACSCSSTSFTGASPASRGCLSSASASASSSSSVAPASFSCHHLQHQLPSLSWTNKHALLRGDSEKITKQASYIAVRARQGRYDAPKKNTSQIGGGGGRNASVNVKEDKGGRKGGSTGSRNPKPYNRNSNSRSYNSSSNPKFQNNSSSGRRGNSLSSNTIRGTTSLSEFSDEEQENESEDDLEFDEDADLESDGEASLEHLIMPVPPAGFVLAEDGSVAVMAPPHKRVTTLVDSQTKLPLDCLIRRVFSSSDGRQCFLLCPLDTPLQILKIDDGEVLKEISDEELDDIFPAASYELAKQRLHLVRSGFCLTLRGGFCFNEEDVMDLNTVYGESGDSLLNEGVEVANFVVNDSEYLIFTPLDPLMFVAYKDEEAGELFMADDDLLDDEAVLDAIDDEKEFQAYMEGDVIADTNSDEEEE